MTARVPAGAVLVDPQDRAALAWCVREACRSLATSGRAVPQRLLDLAEVLASDLGSARAADAPVTRVATSDLGSAVTGEVAGAATMAPVTTSQAAERLGVSDRRVRQLVAGGVLVAERAGRVLLVDAEALAAYAAQREEMRP